MTKRRFFAKRLVYVGAIALPCIIAFVLWSCAKLQSQLPVQPLVSASPHPTGWIDTTSPNFHGLHLRNEAFTFSALDSCANCHGHDFSGGQVQKSCSGSGCHTAADGGPVACYNCHGDRELKTWNPPRSLFGSYDSTYVAVGNHRGHLFDTTLSNHVYMQCKTCHVVPDSFWQASHIWRTTLDSVNGSARITFGDSLAFKQTNVLGGYKYDATLPTYTPNPQWDSVTHSCSNVYCHGYFRGGNLTNAQPGQSRIKIHVGRAMDCHQLTNINPATSNATTAMTTE